MTSSISLQSIPAFDALYDRAIHFNYSGPQCVKNRLVVYDSASDAVVYDQMEISMLLSHVIPAGVLVNGTRYNCAISVYDIENNFVTSSKVSFRCLTTPIFGFSGLVDGQTYRNAVLVLNLNYQQAQNEPLNEYKVTLYRANLTPIWESGVLFGDPEEITINGLEHGAKYYVKATGTTVSGMYVDTSHISFICQYDVPLLYSLIILENRGYEGAVKITSNIVGNTGSSSHPEVKFINLNSPPSKDGWAVDLREPGHYVTFYDDLKIGTDYIATFNGFRFSLGLPIFKVDSPYDSVVVTWKRELFSDGNNYVYAELTLLSDSSFVLRSNPILDSVLPQISTWGDVKSLTWGDLLNYTWQQFIDRRIYNVWIKAENGAYDIKIADIGIAIPIPGSTEMSFVYYSDNIIGATPSRGHTFTLLNGAFDEFSVTTDVAGQYSTEIPDGWDYNKILHAKFTKDLFAGNMRFYVENADKIRIKRRKKGTLMWVPLYEKAIYDQNDFTFELYDYQLRRKWRVMVSV